MTPHLTSAGTDALLAEPVLLHVLWHRPGHGHKWRKVGQCATRAACVNLMSGSGEFWLAEIREPSLAGTLFDGISDEECVAAAHPATTQPGPLVAVTTGPASANQA